MEGTYAVPRAEWQAMNEKAREALRSFLVSELFQRIRASDARRWLPRHKVLHPYPEERFYGAITQGRSPVR